MFFVNFDREIWCFSQMWNNIWNMKISFSQKDTSHVTHIGVTSHMSHVTYESRHEWVSYFLWHTNQVSYDARHEWNVTHTNGGYVCIRIYCTSVYMSIATYRHSRCVCKTSTHMTSLWRLVLIDSFLYMNEFVSARHWHICVLTHSNSHRAETHAINVLMSCT